MDIRKVNLMKEPMDEKNYAYAVCECTLSYEALKIPRPKHFNLIKFNCPYCGKGIGIYAKGTLDT